MRRIAMATLLALALPPLTVLAAPAGAAWYGGGALGVTAYGHGVGSFDDGSIRAARVDDEDTGWKLFGGYRFFPFFGVELGYVDLDNDFDGSPTFRGVSDGSGPLYQPGDVSIDISSPTGYYAAAVGRLPIGTKAALFGKLGLFDWEADVTTVNAGLVVDGRRSGTDSMMGVGFEYRLLRPLRLRAEWERYVDVVGADVDLVSIGVSAGLPFP